MSRKTTTLCTMAVLGAAFGLVAMFYLVSAWSLTLKGLGGFRERNSTTGGPPMGSDPGALNFLNTISRLAFGFG